MSLWSIIVIAVSIIDIILLSLLARDYTSCTDNIIQIEDVFCFLVNGIGMTIAARGFVLWLLNVASAAVNLYFGLKVSPLQIKKIQK